MAKFDQLSRKIDSFLKFAEDASGLTDTSAAKMAAEVSSASIEEWLRSTNTNSQRTTMSIPQPWLPLWATIKDCAKKVGSLSSDELKALLDSAQKMNRLPAGFDELEKKDWQEMVMPDLQSIISVVGDILNITANPTKSTFA